LRATWWRATRTGFGDIFVHDRSASPQDQIRTLAAIVQRLVDKGILNEGQGRALEAKLNAAARSLKNGNTTAACGQLAAFIHQVRALGLPQKDKDAQALLAGAISLRKQLGCH
jgi:hypothetical protein